MSELTVLLKKKADGSAALSCRRADGSVTWQRQEGDQSYFGERYQGSFRRQITLGDGLDLENLEADLHDGVLTVRIPVAEKAKPRKISIDSGSNGDHKVITAD